MKDVWKISLLVFALLQGTRAYGREEHVLFLLRSGPCLGSALGVRDPALTSVFRLYTAKHVIENCEKYGPIRVEYLIESGMLQLIATLPMLLPDFELPVHVDGPLRFKPNPILVKEPSCVAFSKRIGNRDSRLTYATHMQTEIAHVAKNVKSIENQSTQDRIWNNWLKLHGIGEGIRMRSTFSPYGISPSSLTRTESSNEHVVWVEGDLFKVTTSAQIESDSTVSCDLSQGSSGGAVYGAGGKLVGLIEGASDIFGAAFNDKGPVGQLTFNPITEWKLR